MTEEKFQGAIDLINEITDSDYQLEQRDGWNWSLVVDGGNVIADGGLDFLWDIFLSEAKTCCCICDD